MISSCDESVEAKPICLDFLYINSCLIHVYVTLIKIFNIGLLESLLEQNLIPHLFFLQAVYQLHLRLQGKLIVFFIYIKLVSCPPPPYLSLLAFYMK